MPNIIFSEGSNVANSAFGLAQAPIKSVILQQAQLWEDRMLYPKIAKQETSTHAMEQYSSFTDLGDYEAVGENGAYPSTGYQEGFKRIIENVTWKSQFAISQEAMEDATLPGVKQGASKLGRTYERTREKLVADFLASAVSADSVNRGKFSFSTKGADGVRLFSTAHPNFFDSGITQSNLFADEFSSDALKYAAAAMNGFKDEDGEYVDIEPKTIIIPNDPALLKAVLAAVGTPDDPETANNAFNYSCGIWNVLVWQQLNAVLGNNSGYWFLLDGDYNELVGTIILQNRTAQSIKSVIDDNDANVWKGRCRFGIGANDWRGICVGGVGGGTQLITS